MGSMFVKNNELSKGHECQAQVQILKLFTYTL